MLRRRCQLLSHRRVLQVRHRRTITLRAILGVPLPREGDTFIRWGIGGLFNLGKVAGTV
jgi:hypothetical protein